MARAGACSSAQVGLAELGDGVCGEDGVAGAVHAAIPGEPRVVAWVQNLVARGSGLLAHHRLCTGHWDVFAAWPKVGNVNSVDAHDGCMPVVGVRTLHGGSNNFDGGTTHDARPRIDSNPDLESLTPPWGRDRTVAATSLPVLPPSGGTQCKCDDDRDEDSGPPRLMGPVVGGERDPDCGCRRQDSLCDGEASVDSTSDAGHGAMMHPRGRSADTSYPADSRNRFRMTIVL